jgi:hypothetical protein
MDIRRQFSKAFFIGEPNRFIGSGGEVIVKGPGNTGGDTLIEVGDSLIGIGVTHLVEGLGRTPGPDAFRPLTKSHQEPSKKALRAFQVAEKREVSGGFDFSFKPLAPAVYSALLESVSDAAVSIPAEEIPEGTIILSFLEMESNYTLQRLGESAKENWLRTVAGEKHWCVGIGSEEDFWNASFPSDDVGVLSLLPPYVKVGEIRFGLSLLSKKDERVKFRKVPAIMLGGQTTYHDFCLNGSAAGTAGLNTPFYIGLRTEIVFHPEE